MKTKLKINKELTRAMTRQTLISRDLVEGIRYYCFSNFTEFYRRHEKELNMSYTTFSRALRGLDITDDTLQSIEELAVDLGLYNSKTGGSDYIAYKVVRREFCKKIDAVIKSFSCRTWEALVQYYIEHKQKIIG